MIKRTTVEIDQGLLERAKKALGEPTMRATIEEALRRVALAGEAVDEARAERQRHYLERLQGRADLQVMASEAMWR